MSINLKRGALRAWIVVALLWIVGAVTVQILTFDSWHTLAPTEDIIKARSLDAIHCAGLPVPKEFTDRAIEELRVADKNGDKVEATRLANAIRRTDDCAKIIESETYYGIFLKDAPDDKWQLAVGAAPGEVIGSGPRNINAEKVADIVSHHYAIIRHKETMDLLFKDGAIALLPPLALLLAGVAIAWVLAGFREQH